MPRRTPKNLPAIQHKRGEVVRLRAEGLTWDEIARRTGYSGGSGAYKAWVKAIRQAPDESVAEIRRQEKTRLEQMDSVMSGIIANPPIRATSIGRVMWDPRTCTCGVKGDTKRDHADDCQVQPVLDAGAVVRASAERRAIGESLRRLVNADATPRLGSGFSDDQVRQLAEVLAAKRELDRQAPPPPLALPANYTSMTPAEQAAADLAARRASLEAQRATIPGEIISG